MQFFISSFTYASVKAWFALIATILEIRIFLCFATWIPVLQTLAKPLCYVLDWEHDHWLLGCLDIDDERLSLISVVPIWFARNVVAVLLARPEFVVPFRTFLTTGVLHKPHGRL